MSQPHRLDVPFQQPASARGRNGDFAAVEATVASYPDGRFSLAVRSARSGNAAPVYLELSNEDAHRLAQAIDAVL
jgi:hypothetical protein